LMCRQHTGGQVALANSPGPLFPHLSSSHGSQGSPLDSSQGYSLPHEMVFSLTCSSGNLDFLCCAMLLQLLTQLQRQREWGDLENVFKSYFNVLRWVTHTEMCINPMYNEMHFYQCITASTLTNYPLAPHC
jgi:hypothetical protein